MEGFISGQQVQTYLGIATAVACSAVCSYGYFKNVLIYWQLKWQRARDDFRREQELLDAETRAKIARIERGESKPGMPCPTE
jgi:hypothetical protein